MFIIDTPPPFTSGGLHIGRAYSCILSDLVARYRRMKGYNVLLPQGWDTQGLPTELTVQNKLGISTEDTERFREECRKWTDKMIKQMKKKMFRLGYSPDWKFEYKTMEKEYHKRVQLALLNLYEKGRIYRAKHPVHWCPKCKTSLAQAELGYVPREGILAYIKFKLGSQKQIEIATTRPELLHACVAIAVNPKDERYKQLVGKEVEIPLFDRMVPALADLAVDPEFGTGIVMICTFGDEQDVKWILRHNLQIIEAIDENGRIINSQIYDGLAIKEARKQIIRALEISEALSKIERIKHNVLSHTERSACRTPVEFLMTKQWFVRITDLKPSIIKLAKEIEWVPEYFKLRLINWVESLEWDWIFSRQRIFGTPIPFWYCKKCDRIIPPKKEKLPVNPAEEEPYVERCPECGDEVVGTEDVCDCWVDSSITPLMVSGWPKERIKDTVDLRQQGSEIIRTWAFYSIVQSYLQTGRVPFNTAFVNGMILGPDGKAMSSSLGNVIDPLEVIEKYNTDSLRQALLLPNPGEDFPFNWKDIHHCNRFLRKLWNASRFAFGHLYDYEHLKNIPKLHPIDKWILSLLERLIIKLTKYMDAYRFSQMIQELQEFFWHEFCDYYLEFIKYRLYDPKHEWMKQSAQYTLYNALWTILRLLAPIAPHITEEIYHRTYVRDEKSKTIHLTRWPEVQEKLIDETSEKVGEVLKQIISAIRTYKSNRNLPLSIQLTQVTILHEEEKDLDEILRSLREDIKQIGKIERVTIQRNTTEKSQIILHSPYGKIGLKITS